MLVLYIIQVPGGVSCLDTVDSEEIDHWELEDATGLLQRRRVSCDETHRALRNTN